MNISKAKETFMRGIIVCGLCGLAFLLIGCTTEKSDAKKIPMDKVPSGVMDSVNSRFPGAQVTSVEKETEEGNIVYDVEMQHEGRHCEMDIKDDGTVMEIEKQIDPPASVTNAIKNKWPNATIKEVMEKDKVMGKQETRDSYEVTISTDSGKEKEVVVGMDGSVKEEAPEAK